MQVRTERDAAKLSVHFQGNVGAKEAGAAYAALCRLASEGQGAEIRIDLREVHELDSVAAGALAEGAALLEKKGASVRWSELSERQRSALELATPKEQRDSEAPSVEEKPAKDELLRPLVNLAELVVDTGATALKIPLAREKPRFSAVADQAVRLGVDALPIVLLLSFLTGLILAFQAAFQLRKFGAEPLVAEIVGLGMVREFASLMTAIILSGRSGAAITAELGTMAVREELDALRTMGISPISFLIVPRVIALLVLEPLLTIWSMAVGMLGGLITSKIVGLPVPAIYARMRDSLSLADFTLGVGKSVLFAVIIVLTGSYLGMRTRGGARSVGTSTTRSVVTSITLIVIVDSVVTTLWTNAGLGRH